METITETWKSAPDANAATPEALDIEPTQDVVETGSLWGRYMPRDVSFFKMAMLDQLQRRPYHTVTQEGPFNLQQLSEDFSAQTFRSETNLDRSGNTQIVRLLLRLDGEIFGYLEDHTLNIYAPTPEAAKATAKTFRRYVKTEAAAKPFFYVISIEDHGPVTETVPVERSAPVTNDELALNYGEDFLAWERGWTERMQSTPSGLTILHGPPGCGKTSYLRALMARLLDSAVFYFIPVSDADMLSNPRFVGFWLQQTKVHEQKRKIAILEDAEEMLLPRDAGTRDKVSNLLNLADGFLGDHLKLQIIATTNAPMRSLDSALLRPGRLVGMREFRRLTRPEAQRLAMTKGLVLPEQNDFSLADLYCGAVSSPTFIADRQMGFAQ